MKYLSHNKASLALLFGALIFLNACKEKTDDPIPELSANAKVNTWIQEMMDTYYLWLGDMKNPIALDSDPEDYFESLLFRPTDRFSAIYPDYEELMRLLTGVSKEAGYEIILARESNINNNVIAFVTYTKKGSPAENKGMKRGDLITQINGVRMNLDNYQELLGLRSEAHTVSLFRYNEETNNYVALPPVDLTTEVLSENPNYIDTIYTIGNQKIGYFVYNFFAPGIEGQPSKYDNEMDAIFSKFKAGGINHLILDLRYNGGGLVESTLNLGSLIAPGVTNTDVFFKRKYNSFLMSFDQFKNIQYEFESKPENLGPILTGNRVYVITSSRTASASELTINGLKPYMDVFMVGGLTLGKNVGSIVIEDEENPENKYGLIPIVHKSYNKNDQSDYSNGFQPNIQGNELSQPNLLPLGDTNEFLLKLTLEQITGIPSSDRVKLIDRIDLGSSIENHPRFGKMIDNKTKFNLKQ
ncbi:S41 family peptidase [Cognataquiflexum rubidum]|uniref:S41 family peptidase n=1 Tax=Cognataquiflexum rubidum TaxID=2922273 RepID=UPI001F13E506|nr:S41 family peptidase [Cognataquiflexum rubidum]MCH6233071.1 S41 family peptidase [Cognataquiflexum rubidum]